MSFKIVVLGVILSCAVVKTGCGQPLSTHDDSSPDISLLPKYDSNNVLNPLKNGQNNFYTTHQNIYLGGVIEREPRPPIANNDPDRELNADYVVTEEIGAHKLHRRKLPWNKARRICVEEGGHLVIIATETEKKIVEKMSQDASTDGVWIGYHDMFEHDDWTSILDEPLENTWLATYSKTWSQNNKANLTDCANSKKKEEHCAQLLKNGDMGRESCEKTLAFICKVSINK